MIEECSAKAPLPLPASGSVEVEDNDSIAAVCESAMTTFDDQLLRW